MAKRGLTKMGLGFRLGITCDLQIHTHTKKICANYSNI